MTRQRDTSNPLIRPSSQDPWKTPAQKSAGKTTPKSASSSSPRTTHQPKILSLDARLKLLRLTTSHKSDVFPYAFPGERNE